MQTQSKNSKKVSVGLYVLVITSLIFAGSVAGVLFNANSAQAFGFSDFARTLPPEEDPVPLPRPIVCGDNIKDTGEECDGADFGSTSCTSLGFESGGLTCSDSCTIVTAQCTQTSNGGGGSNTNGGGGGGGGTVELIIYNETTQAVAIPTAVVRWYTNKPGTTRVVYDSVSHDSAATDENFGYASSTPLDSNIDSQHEVTLPDLTPGVTYYWRAVSGDPIEKIGVEMSFSSPAPETESPATEPDTNPEEETTVTPEEETIPQAEAVVPQDTSGASAASSNTNGNSGDKTPAQNAPEENPIVLGVSVAEAADITEDATNGNEVASATPTASAPDSENKTNYFAFILAILVALGISFYVHPPKFIAIEDTIGEKKEENTQTTPTEPDQKNS